MNDARQSIAIVVPGGIGTGANNLGVPVLERLVILLSRDFNITVFSLFRINKDYQPTGFELVDVSHKVKLVRFTRLLLAVRHHHKRKRFSVIHGFWALPSGLFAVLLGRTLGIKSIVSLLGGDAIALPEIRYGQLQRWFPRKLVLWTLSHAQEVIMLTQFQWDNLKRFGLKRKNVRIAPFGVDSQLFPFGEKPMGATIRFLHVANFHPVKDQETLLRAFNLINEQVSSHLTIVGEGILEHQVKALADRLLNAKSFTFIKAVPNDQMAGIYKRADILLHTSLSEGLPAVVMEAMSSGVVVCGTSVGLLYDFPDYCVSVAVRDYQALAFQTMRILKDSSKFADLRKKAGEWSHRHSMDWTVEQIKKYYAIH